MTTNFDKLTREAIADLLRLLPRYRVGVDDMSTLDKDEKCLIPRTIQALKEQRDSSHKTHLNSVNKVDIEILFKKLHRLSREAASQNSTILLGVLNTIFRSLETEQAAASHDDSAAASAGGGGGGSSSEAVSSDASQAASKVSPDSTKIHSIEKLARELASSFKPIEQKGGLFFGAMFNLLGNGPKDARTVRHSQIHSALCHLVNIRQTLGLSDLKVGKIERDIFKYTNEKYAEYLETMKDMEAGAACGIG